MIMSKSLGLYNLNFLQAKDFQPFTIDDYVFSPIPNKQPQIKSVNTSVEILTYNRNMHLNAHVCISAKQRDSVFRQGGKYSGNRKIKFIEDLLMVISICIGRNVVPVFYKTRLEFPLCSAKHCLMVSRNSTELSTHVKTAIAQIQDNTWQRKYDNGFHVRGFYNTSDILVAEPRFLADVTIWEYLYYCNNRSLTYEELRTVLLNSKINYLVREYLIDTVTAFPQERLRIFSDLRNQLSHNGKLPIENPKSPFSHLGWNGCREYLKLFNHLTQVLVLKTMGIDAFDQLSIFDVRPQLDELIKNGAINLFETLEGFDF
jgi:hypothetical protein